MNSSVNQYTMPIGNVNKEPAVKRETFRPPWVKDKDAAAPPPWMQKKLKPVESTTKPEAEEPAPTSAAPAAKALKLEEKLVKPSAAKSADKATRPADEKPRFTKSALKSSVDKTPKTKTNDDEKVPEKPTLRSVRTIDGDKTKEKSVTIVDKRPTEKARTLKTSNSESNDKTSNDKSTTNSTSKEAETKPKPVVKKTEIPKVEENSEETTKMATKPPIEKPPTKLPPRKPSLQKQPSKDEPVKKWRDPLHERVKENIDKTLSEVPKGHTLTKNESLRSLLKPAPPPMPPPLPPKMPPPPEFKKAPLDPEKLKKIENLRSRPRKRPDWSDMMKEVEEGKKLKHVVCNDRSSPIITKSSVVKNKDQFIFESEKPNSHNALLKEINSGIKLKKVKTNDRKEEEIDEMDDIDKVRDDLQSTKQLLAIELRNKEAQERENKRLLTRITNLEAELARERAIIRQEQHKTVISVTDAYDERLVNSLKSEVDRAKDTADNLEKQYLQAAEDRDTALTELEEVKRRNAELEKKLEQALAIEEQYKSEEPLSFYQKRQLDFERECMLLNIDINSNAAQELRKSAKSTNINATASTNYYDEGIMPTNIGSRRSSHAIKQLSITKDDSFEEEEESEAEEVCT
ncbi:hypothetical protein MSG28_005787 [Choristoneura fumiferana]|uniref:Uncharacterized protein n=1 Tax=Choristoneura fumiferana TaxID=7141 RepID=A0ACC0L0A7_CHOFU|nr:hypothetical protein MSG28_005787 [Choristoneura fumiferana]